MEPTNTRSLQKNTKTNSIEISSQKKIDKASALSITFFTYELSFLSTPDLLIILRAQDSMHQFFSALHLKRCTFRNLQIIENTALVLMLLPEHLSLCHLLIPSSMPSAPGFHLSLWQFHLNHGYL